MHDNQPTNIKGQITAAAVLAIFVTLVVMLAERYHVLPEAPDKFIYDWKSSLFSKKIESQRSDIAIVYIDEASLADYPYKSPIDRALIATVIKAIDQAEPKAIGIDIIFDRPTEPNRDNALIHAMQQVKAPLIVVSTVESESGVSRQALEWESAFLAKANGVVATPLFGVEETALNLDDDVVRTMEPFDASGNARKPFALALAEKTGKFTYPSSPLIDWLNPSSDGREVFQTFNVPPHEKVSLDVDPNVIFPKFMQNALANKTVIVAGSLSGSDWHRIPMTVMNNLEVPGAYIHAQILAQILDGRQIIDTPKLFTFVVVFISAFVLYLGAELTTRWCPEIVFEALVIGFAILIGTLMFWAYRVSFPSAHLLMVWFLVAFFGRYTTPVLRRLRSWARK